MAPPSSRDSRGPTRERFLRFPARLLQLAVRFLCKAEIVGALDVHFLCNFEDLANDVEIVYLGFSVDHPGIQETLLSKCNSFSLEVKYGARVSASFQLINNVLCFPGKIRRFERSQKATFYHSQTVAACFAGTGSFRLRTSRALSARIFRWSSFDSPISPNTSSAASGFQQG